MGDAELAEYEVDPTVVAVVAGMDFNFTYKKLCIASLYMQLNGSKFIATNCDRVYSTAENLRGMPAGGSIIK